MFGIQASAAKQYVDKLAVASEQGLTNAQLMLTNHDLRPGEMSIFADSILPCRCIGFADASDL